ncbi:hypothetical protein BH09SUM1_BH09SUM1_14080 [soil metagenome]
MVGPKLSARSYALLILAVLGLAFTTNLVAQYNQSSGVSSSGDNAAATREIAAALQQVAASNREIATAIREVNGTMKEAASHPSASRVDIAPPVYNMAPATSEDGKVMLQGSPATDNSGAPAEAPNADQDKGTFKMRK